MRGCLGALLQDAVWTGAPRISEVPATALLQLHKAVWATTLKWLAEPIAPE